MSIWTGSMAVPQPVPLACAEAAPKRILLTKPRKNRVPAGTRFFVLGCLESGDAINIGSRLSTEDSEHSGEYVRGSEVVSLQWVTDNHWYVHLLGHDCSVS